MRELHGTNIKTLSNKNKQKDVYFLVLILYIYVCVSILFVCLLVGWRKSHETLKNSVN